MVFRISKTRPVRWLSVINARETKSLDRNVAGRSTTRTAPAMCHTACCKLSSFDVFVPQVTRLVNRVKGKWHGAT